MVGGGRCNLMGEEYNGDVESGWKGRCSLMGG